MLFRDIAPEGENLKETNENLDELTDLALELQKETGVKLLWATCNLFANPRYLTMVESDVSNTQSAKAKWSNHRALNFESYEPQ